MPTAAKQPERIHSVDGVIDYLREQIRKIDEDERYHYPSANTDVNAPLALVQLGMETKVDFAQHLLERIGYDGPEMFVRKGPKK